MELAEYSLGTIHIRGLQQTPPPGTIRQACKSVFGQSPLKVQPFPRELVCRFPCGCRGFLRKLLVDQTTKFERNFLGESSKLGPDITFAASRDRTWEDR